MSKNTFMYCNLYRARRLCETNPFCCAKKYISAWNYEVALDYGKESKEQPCGINRPSISPINSMIDGGHETEFRRMFHVSQQVFEALVQDLSPWITDGRSRNGCQNVEARVKVGIALVYMAYVGDGITLGAISGLKNNSALMYLHQVSAAIFIHTAPK